MRPLAFLSPHGQGMAVSRSPSPWSAMSWRPRSLITAYGRTRSANPTLADSSRSGFVLLNSVVSALLKRICRA